MLVKKLMNYYDALDESFKAMPNNRRKSSRSPTKRLPKELKNKNFDYYEDTNKRASKLRELKQLMRAELKRAETEGDPFHPDMVDITKSISGYPSFMKENSSKLKQKQFLRKGTAQANQAVFKKGVLENLLDKVVEANSKSSPQEIQEDMNTVASNQKDGFVFDSHLCVLETTKTYLYEVPGEADQKDFHERKSKEIRRLQFIADWKARQEEKKLKKLRKTQTPQIVEEESLRESEIIDQRKVDPAAEEKRKRFLELIDALSRSDLPREEKIKRILELERLLEAELEEMDAVNSKIRRSTPEESYNVWVILQDGNSYPGKMRSIDGFKISDNDDLLEVREGDCVIVLLDEAPEIQEIEIQEEFDGTVMKADQEEGDCDFIVQSGDGTRWRMLISQREEEDEKEQDLLITQEHQDFTEEQDTVEERVIENPNVNAVDSQGNLLGDGNITVFRDLELQNELNYSKGILVTDSNQTFFVIFNRINDGEAVIIRTAVGAQFVDMIKSESEVMFSNPDGRAVLLTLGEPSPVTGLQSLLYYVEEDTDPFSKETINLLIGEKAVLSMASNTYSGILSEDEESFRIRLVSLDGEGSEDEFIYIEAHEEERNRESASISELLEKIKDLAQSRKFKEEDTSVVIEDNEGNVSKGLLEGHIQEGAEIEIKSEQGESIKGNVGPRTRGMDIGEFTFALVDGRGRKLKITVVNEGESESQSVADSLQENADEHYRVHIQDKAIISPNKKRRTKEERRMKGSDVNSNATESRHSIVENKHSVAIESKHSKISESQHSRISESKKCEVCGERNSSKSKSNVASNKRSKHSSISKSINCELIEDKKSVGVSESNKSISVQSKKSEQLLDSLQYKSEAIKKQMVDSSTDTPIRTRNTEYRGKRSNKKELIEQLEKSVERMRTSVKHTTEVTRTQANMRNNSETLKGVRFTQVEGDQYSRIQLSMDLNSSQQVTFSGYGAVHLSNSPSRCLPETSPTKQTPQTKASYSPLGSRTGGYLSPAITALRRLEEEAARTIQQFFKEWLEKRAHTHKIQLKAVRDFINDEARFAAFLRLWDINGRRTTPLQMLAQVEQEL